MYIFDNFLFIYELIPMIHSNFLMSYSLIYYMYTFFDFTKLLYGISTYELDLLDLTYIFELDHLLITL